MIPPLSPAEALKPGHRTRVIAVANQKGGVGKSTTAVSLGAALAEMGRRVLVMDLDPQGNASTGLGIRHDARRVTVYDVLANDAPINEAVVRTAIPNLFGVPSTIDLAGAEIEMVSQFSREMRLRRAMEPLRETGFDFVFLDCPPSLGLLTVNAMAAAQELIVPIQCEYYALEGLGQLIKNVRLVQQNVNPTLRLSGIVMTMFDPRTKLSEQVVDEVRRYFGDRVYDTIIPRTVRLSEAPGFGQPITVYDPRSIGARRYRELAGELVHREPADEPVPVMENLPSVIMPPLEPVPMTAPRPLRPERTSSGGPSGTGEDGGSIGREGPDEVPAEPELSEEEDAGQPSTGGSLVAGGIGQRSGPEEALEHIGAPVEATVDEGRASSADETHPAQPQLQVEPRQAAQGVLDREPTEQPEPDQEEADQQGAAQESPEELTLEQRLERARAARQGRPRGEESSSLGADEAPPSEGAEEQKRRWSLFRKGGRG